MQSPTNGFREEDVEGMPGVRRFFMKHLQTLDNVLADVK